MKIDNWHPFAERFPMLDGDDWESFKQSISRAKGNREPVTYRKVRGKVQGIDGRLRYRACTELGIKCRMQLVALPESEVRDFILDKNVHRRHVTRELRKELAEEMKAEGLSNRAIAEKLQVSEGTIRSDLSGAQNYAPEIQGVATPSMATAPKVIVGRDGKNYPAPPPKPPQPDPKLIPELRARDLSPKFIPQIEALDTTQQAALNARLNEGKFPGTALAEVLGNIPSTPQQDTFHYPGSTNGTIPCGKCACCLAAKKKVPAAERSALFDAVAEVTGSDVKASGGHIAKVVKALLSAEPPYTPEEVHRWAELLEGEGWLKGYPSLGLLEKSIGKVRAKPKKGERLFAGFQAFLDKGNQ